MQNLTLDTVLDLFLSKLKWLLLGLVCGTLLLASYTVLFVEDTYEASVSLYVQNTKEEVGAATTNNLYASRMLTNSYVVILCDIETLEKAAERITEEATLADIARSLSVKASEDSAIITVTAKTNDAVLSQAICQAIANVAPDMLPRMVGAGVIKSLGDVPPAVKTGPNIVMNCILGGVGGLLLVAAVVLVMYLLDLAVKNKEELMSLTNLPVLGEIPSLTV